MKKSGLLVLLLLASAAPALARELTVVLNSSAIVKGELVGANETSLFVESRGQSREIRFADIKEVLDAQTSERVVIAPMLSREPGPSLSPDAAEPAAMPEKPGPKNYFELFGYAALSNAYAIGAPLQDWMNDDVQSGPPSFANFGGTGYLGLDPEGAMHLGIGATVNLPPPHSIRGSNVFSGGQHELVLDPYTFSLDLPFRYAFPGTNLSLSLEPSLLLTFLSGQYSTSGFVNLDSTSVTGTFYTNMGSMGLGFGVGLGAQYSLGMFGLGVKAGLRMLKSQLSFDSVVGPWSPRDSSGNAIPLDLSGAYLTIGLTMKFGI